MKINPLVFAVSALPFFAPLATVPAAAQGLSVALQEAVGKRQVAALIALHPKGGKELTAAIATLIKSQTSLAAVAAMTEAVVADAADAAPDVVSALAAGLAQGKALLAKTNPSAPKTIDGIVAASGNSAFAAEFSVAYSVALTTDPSQRAGIVDEAQAAVQAASLPGYTTALGNTLVSPN